MAETMDGLFGPTPLQIQQQQYEAQKAFAEKLSGMDSLQQAKYGAAMAGSGIGGMLSNALGVKSPQMEMATSVQDVQKGIDHSTPEGLLEGAQKIKDINPALAQKYVQAAQAMKLQNSKIELEAAQAKKALAYQPAGYGNTKEYQDQVDIVTDPNSTPEEVQFAKDRIAALNAKGAGRGGILGAGTVKRMATSIGEIIFDPASKKYTYADGSDVAAEDLRKMVPLGNDPTNAAAVSMAKAGNKTKSEAMAKAQDALPEATNTYNQSIDLMSQIEKDPAFSSLIGFTWTPGARKIPGSKEAGLDAKLQQLSSLAEMHQRDKLKGTGQITDYESNMARGAIFRASSAQNEDDYRKAMADFKYWMGKSMQALSERASTPFKMPETPAIAPQRNTTAPAAPATTAPISAKTPQEVKSLYQGGKLTKQQANDILDDMKSRGLF